MVKVNQNSADESMILNYSTYSGGQVRIHILDASGKLIEELLNRFEEAGDHSVMWSTSSLEPGVYLYSIATRDGRLIRTILLPIRGQYTD